MECSCGYVHVDGGDSSTQKRVQEKFSNMMTDEGLSAQWQILAKPLITGL